MPRSRDTAVKDRSTAVQEWHTLTIHNGEREHCESCERNSQCSLSPLYMVSVYHSCSAVDLNLIALPLDLDIIVNSINLNSANRSCSGVAKKRKVGLMPRHHDPS